MRADRVLGTLLGVHAGDALGATVEFLPWQEVRRRYPDGVRDVVGGGPFAWPAGHATDDTDLTRAVLLAYLEPGDDVVTTTADRMLDWYEGRWPGRQPGSRPVDVGGATARGLDRYRSGRDARGSGAGAGAAGNGSLMRCSPTALAVHDRARRLRDAVELSAVTHDDPRCTVACAAYVEIVAALLDGRPPADAVRAGQAAATELDGEPVMDALAAGAELDLATAVRTGETGLPDAGGGYVLDSLALAVSAVLDPRPLEDVLVDVVRLGADSDTNGAIAGGLLGARDGATAIPARWVERLQFAAEFTTAAARLS